jgi:hypothetical protein
MSARLSFLTVAAAVLSLAAHASGEPKVSLRLEAQERQRIVDGLVVRVSVQVEHVEHPVVRPPLLDVPSWAHGLYPVTDFRAEVIDASGQPLGRRPPSSERVIYVQPEPPKPCQFHIFSRDGFVGRSIRLDGPEYRYVLRPGKVRVTLRSFSTAREWLTAALAQGGLQKEQMCFRIDDVFTAPLVSNTIEIALE